MSNVLNITLPAHLDAVKISEYIANEIPIEIEINNLYATQIATVTQLSINELSSKDLLDLVNIINKLTGTFEVGSYIFSIEKNGKIFSLAKSFFRDAVDIPNPATEIPVGTAIMARFEIPGFQSNTFREITIFYKSAFDPADLVLLKEIGIDLAGDGGEFTISNDVDCKISFYKPAVSEIEYIIDFLLYNEIIPANE